ncbi:MAG: hypothetical protein K6G25_11285 [Bacteroidales bacterium]|nr:hypothetical protein [Bacteroidales bacterium]
MTITDYYKNYLLKYPNQLPVPNNTDNTINDFYENCIKLNMGKSNVLDWHNMFMEYVDLDDAVFWIRYYESGKKVNNRYSNRRACYTEFKDGFSYVFVSNFDVHEIFNMIRHGVSPDVHEFLDLMKSFNYPLHYDPGKNKKNCEETDICAYPNIGSPQGGVLTMNHWYLAHINAIKGAYRRIDGTVQELSDQEINRIYPRGIVSDWKRDPVDGIMKRKQKYCLSQEEKDLVKAHFLRFVDPLNYFVVPGVYYEINDIYGDKKKSIGEYDDLNLFVSLKYELEYGKKAFKEFNDKALIGVLCNTNNPSLGQEVINIKYGSVLKTKNSHKNANKSTNTKIKTSSNINKTKNVKSMPRINSKNILATLRGMQAAGTLPATVTLTNKTNFKVFLETKTDVNAIGNYLNSIESNAFNMLLKKQKLPQNIYACSDMNKLVDVLDELVNNQSSPDVSAALGIEHAACRPALCYLIVHLLLNSIAANLLSKMGITI